MSIFYNIVLLITLSIFMLALVLLTISVALEMIVSNIKKDNMKLIPTNIEGRYMREYQIPTKYQPIIKLNKSMLKYKPNIKLGLWIAALLLSIPLFKLILSTLFTLLTVFR